jgi:hypothetical protein
MRTLDRNDYLSLKWPLLAFVSSVALSAVLWTQLTKQESTAARALNTARASLNQAQTQLAAIQKDEQLLNAYSDRYQQLLADGVVGEPDRLQFQEYFAELRAEHALFPIDLNINELQSFDLPLTDGRKSTDWPILLQGSVVDFKLPLLHENDLAALLHGLHAKPELLLPHSCKIDRTGQADSYNKLGQHLSAECSLLWLGFMVRPAQATTSEAAQ